jgi:hypothetical protein
MRHNKTNTCVYTYPSPGKATDILDSNVNPILLNEDARVFQSSNGLKHLKDNDTLQVLDSKNLVTKTCKNTPSEITADLSAPELLGPFLRSVSSSFSNEQEGRVTAVVAKARYQKATQNQAKQRVEHSARSRLSNAVIKILLDSGSDGYLMFHEKGPMHFPYLTRQVPNSWHVSNGSFAPKGRSEVGLKFFEYSNSMEFLVTPDVVEYEKNKVTKLMYDLILGCKTMKEIGIFLTKRH